MYISQKTFTIIFLAAAVLVGGWLLLSNVNKAGENINLNPTPDTSLFSTPPRRNQQTMNRQVKRYATAPATLSAGQLQNKKAVVVTNKGTVEFEIFADTPVASSNFISLANDKFYDGLTFHRVEPGFVVQGGDPLGNGQGGPGYKVVETNIKGDYSKGVVAWAKSATDPKGAAGSQFFIMLSDTPLPPEYSSFGKVTRGQEVVDQIRVGDVIEKVTIEPLK